MEKQSLKRARQSSIQVVSLDQERVPVKHLEKMLTNTRQWLESEISPFAKKAAAKKAERRNRT